MAKLDSDWGNGGRDGQHHHFAQTDLLSIFTFTASALEKQQLHILLNRWWERQVGKEINQDGVFNQ